MINYKSNSHMFIAGKSQRGKSTLMKSFVNNIESVVIHDFKHEHKNFAIRNGYKVCHRPETLRELINKGIKRIVYQPVSPDREDFDEVCKAIFMHGNFVFVIDEASSYASTGRVPHWCGQLLRLGSSRGIGVLSLSQRPRFCDNTLLSEASIIISFRLDLDTDRVKIEQTCGKIVNPKLPDDPEEAAKIKSLANLKPYHFMVYSSDENTVSWHTPIPVKIATPMKAEPKIEEPIKTDEGNIPS